MDFFANEVHIGRNQMYVKDAETGVFARFDCLCDGELSLHVMTPESTHKADCAEASVLCQTFNIYFADQCFLGAYKAYIEVIKNLTELSVEEVQVAPISDLLKIGEYLSKGCKSLTRTLGEMIEAQSN